MADFPALATDCAREALAVARARQLPLLFDYRGPLLAVSIDAAALRRRLQAQLLALVDLLDIGILIAEVQAELAGAGRCRLCLKLAGTGLMPPEDTITQVLQRLALQPAQAPADGSAWRAQGRCRATGAEITFALLPGEGFVLRADWLCSGMINAVACELPSDLPQAWVVDDDTLAGESLARRLRRLGWMPVRCSSPGQALRRLDQAPPPSLLIVSAPVPHAMNMLSRLQAALPATTRCVLALPPPSVAQHSCVPPPTQPLLEGFETLWLPLGPADLMRLGRRALDVAARPRVLVLGEDSMQRLLTVSLARSIGAEVDETAAGADVLQHCLDQPPHLLLVDLDHPPSDGLAAVRALRHARSRGALPGFGLVGLTGRTYEVARPSMQRGPDAGLDVCWTKPLAPGRLRGELTRWLRQRELQLS